MFLGKRTTDRMVKEVRNARFRKVAEEFGKRSNGNPA